MTVSSATEYQVIPTQKVRVIAEVYSDRPIDYVNGFFYGIVRGKSRNWSVIETIGDQGLKIASDWFEVPGTSSIEEEFSNFNPGFYTRNCRLTVQVAS